MPESKILILGCGYLGQRLAQQALSNHCQVHALTRNPKTLSQLQSKGIENGAACYLHSKDWHAQFTPSDYKVIYVTVGSSESTREGYHQSYIEGLESVIEWTNGFEGKLIFTSSTSVYADTSGDWLDEKTTPAPRDWRGEIIWEAEKRLHSHPTAHTTAFRLGGIYGPDRNRFLVSQKPLTDSSDYFLNLIHVEDAADALLKAGLSEKLLESTYNLTDNHPFTRRALQAYVEQHHPQRVQPFSSGKRQSRSVNRRIRADLVQQHLDWSPHYPSVFDALSNLV